jgi:hypothetical protein
MISASARVRLVGPLVAGLLGIAAMLTAVVSAAAGAALTASSDVSREPREV